MPARVDDNVALALCLWQASILVAPVRSCGTARHRGVSKWRATQQNSSSPQQAGLLTKVAMQEDVVPATPEDSRGMDLQAKEATQRTMSPQQRQRWI